MGDGLARHEGGVRRHTEAVPKDLCQCAAELRMSQLLGKIDAHVEPGPDELPAMLGVPTVRDAEVEVILKLIGESHEEHRAVVEGQRGDPATQSSNRGFAPGQGGVPCDQSFDLLTDCPSNAGTLRVRHAGPTITKVAMRVGRMEQPGRDHGTPRLQYSENPGGPNRVGEERLPRSAEAAGEEPRRQVVRGPEAVNIRVRIASCEEVVVEPDVCLRRSEGGSAMVDHRESRQSGR